VTPEGKRTHFIDSGLSFTAHALLFVALNLVFIRTPSFSVNQGQAPMEVKLVSSTNDQPDRPSSRRKMLAENSIPMPSKEALLPESDSNQDSAVGMESGNGSQSNAQPNYAMNPPPVYPERARALDQQGTVLLLVEVSAEGRVKDLTIKQSSGFSLLDQAAVRAVRNWVFEPASMGGIHVDAKVEVPVRFKLERAN
jgi:TonB family protein